MSPMSLKFSAAILLYAVLRAPGASAAEAGPPPKPPVGVPADAKHFDGKWYRVYVEKGGWRRAKDRCSVLGGHLATVPDAGTNQFLKELARGLSLWIGATDEKSHTVWHWVDGSRVSFTDWGPGQPNHAAREDYVALWAGQNWHDVFEGEPGVAGFVCEWTKK